MDSIALSSATDGFELSLRARSLSENTIDDYLRTLHALSKHIATDPTINKITRDDIQGFLASEADRLSKKSLLNRWIGLSAFWTWCVQERLVRVHILHGLKPPRPEQRLIDPLDVEEVRAMLAVVERSRPYRLQEVVSGPVDFSLPFASRNRAIIMLLIDTGLRASELCSLSMKDVDLKSGHIKAYGKGDKERLLNISGRTRSAIWKYISSIQDPRPDDPLFLSRGGRRLGREELAHTIHAIGKRANIDGPVHPHRFRHTFAIMYLRNGGDVYTLQKYLGHSTMEMVRRYLALAQVDMDTAHRRASPAENWRL